MNIVFIGDSLTSGENNNFRSYAHYYKENHVDDNVYVFGVSGSCMGDYSIYPVKDNMYDTVYILCNESYIIQDADIIFLEYSINDTTSVATGYTDYTNVCISVVKTVDLIRQLNEDVKIFFIVPFTTDKIDDFARLHVEYLNKEYFNGYSFEVNYYDWIWSYVRIIKFLRSKFYMIYMSDYIDYFDYIDTDNIHLNDNGYKRLAKYIDVFI